MKNNQNLNAPSRLTSRHRHDAISKKRTNRMKLGTFYSMFLGFILLISIHNIILLHRKNSIQLMKNSGPDDILKLPIQNMEHTSKINSTTSQWFTSKDNAKSNIIRHAKPLFQRLYKRSKMMKDWCIQNQLHGDEHEYPHNHTTLSSSSSSKTSTKTNHNIALPPFGFLKDFSQHYNYHEYDILNNTKHGLNSNGIDNEEEWQCALPPKEVHPMMTEEDGYTVIISFAPNNHTHNYLDDDKKEGISSHPNQFRILFINLLYLLTYTDVKNILVLYYGNEEELRNDRDYGQRIWSWHTHDESMIQILCNENTSIKSQIFNHILFSYHPYLLQYFKEDIVMHLNGNDLIVLNNGKFGGEESLRAGYRSIQKNSTRLLGQNRIHFGYDLHLSNNHDASDSFTKKITSIGDKMIDGNIHNESQTYIPQCPLSKEEQNNKNTTCGYSCGIISASKSFLHRNYFCFIWHPVLEKFRTYVEEESKVTRTSYLFDPRNNEAETTNTLVVQSIAISTLISQFSDSIPDIYPLLQTWNKEEHVESESSQLNSQTTRRLSSSVESHDMKCDKPRRRRQNWYVSPRGKINEQKQNEFTEIVRRKLKESDSTKANQKKESNLYVMYDEYQNFINTCRTYFGSKLLY